MKKIKVIAPLLGVLGIAGATIPLVACGNGPQPEIIKVTDIQIEGDSPIEIGKTTKLKIKVLPENATNKKVSFSIDKPKIASFDESGNVLGKSVGDAIITVSSTDGSDISNTFNVSVIPNFEDHIGCVILDDDSFIFFDSFDDTKICDSSGKENIVIDNTHSWKRTSFNKKILLSPKLGYIGNYFLNGCTSFNQILALPTNIETIGEYFLYKCSAFNQALALPNSLIDIGYSFMRDCTNFNNTIDVNCSINAFGVEYLYTDFDNTGTQTLGEWPIINCISESESVNFRETFPNNDSRHLAYTKCPYNYDSKIISTYKGVWCYWSYDGDFRGWFNFETDAIVEERWDRETFNSPIKFGWNVKEVPVYFLDQCYSFNQPIVFPSGLTSIEDYFLRGCKKFNQPLTLPDSLTNIGTQFMKDCRLFNQPLRLPSKITEIEPEFMYQCESFNQPISFPSGLTSIGRSFMSDCYAFNKPLTIPDGVTKIYYDFMADCTSFNQPLTLPNSLTYVGHNFLAWCDNMTSQINIQDLEASVFEKLDEGNLTLATNNDDTAMYQIGIEIVGTNKLDFLQRFPNGVFPERGYTIYRNLKSF